MVVLGAMYAEGQVAAFPDTSSSTTSSLVASGAARSATSDEITAFNSAQEDLAANGPGVRSVPTGGTTGQVLTKVDDTNFNVDWEDSSGGGGGISGLTENTIPKAASGTTLEDSQISDDGSEVTIVNNTFSSSQVGLLGGNSSVSIDNNAIDEIDIAASSAINLDSVGLIKTGDVSGNGNHTYQEIDDPNQIITFGSLVIQLTPQAFGDLPASPSFGMIAAVGDSSTMLLGANVVDGGSDQILAFYNGANWTVFAK